MRPMKVLNRLTVSLKKRKFFQTSVKYLGHVVSQDGVENNPGKSGTPENVAQTPRPETTKVFPQVFRLLQTIFKALFHHGQTLH